MKHFLCLIALTTLTTTLLAVPKFPFPQKVKYPFGIMPTTIDNDKVQKAFEDFMKLYRESNDKTMARIQYDDTNYTVSEGVGYGMMILVYMDNTTNNTQAKFDKLWKYHNNFLDPKGLMNWKIQEFTGPTGMFDKNSATDADLDIAVGLMEAYKQWGDEKYLTDAKALIEKISKNDVTTDGYLNPGDSWGAAPMKYNPSYFNTAVLQLFKQASTFDWDKVNTNSYGLIKKIQNSNTGLVPAWCTKDGTHMSGADDTYQYDATRVPWRMAWAYSWYGHQDAKDIASKMTSWISSKTSVDPTKIVDGYNMDGTPTANGKWNNATFVGPFGCGGMVDATYQAWVDKCYELLQTMQETKYFQISLKMLTLLHLSGNMPDLWSTTSVEPVASRSGTIDNHFSLAFKSSSTPEIAFSTTSSGQVNITLYTVSGKAVSTLANGSYSAGSHCIAITPSLTGGTYIVRMRTAGGELTKRITLAR